MPRGPLSGLLFCALFSCITACHSNTARDLSAPKDVDTKSCVYGFSEGERADFKALGSKEVVRSYFDKEYNFSYLRAISRASVADSISFINRTDVTLYKTKDLPTTGCSAALFADLKPVPSDLRAWADRVEADEGDSVILGLYLGMNKSYFTPSLNQSAAIFVRTNTNRWTLVHEYMHHLFQSRAVELGYDDNMATLEYSLAADALNAAGKGLDEEQRALAQLPAFERYAKALDVYLTQYYLEEIAIEATLKELNRKGELGFVPVGSNWYIHSSAEKFSEKYYELTVSGAEILRKLKAHPQYSTFESRVSTAQASLSAKYWKAQELKIKFPRESRINGILGFDSENHEGCGHSADKESILSKHKLRL